MQFRVGALSYDLIITDHRPISPDGHECDGLADLDQQLISIFTGVRGQRRLNVLLHELRHAWRYHFGAGEAHGEETDCDLSAHYAQQAMADLENQGGLYALDGLVSEAMQTPDVPGLPSDGSGGVMVINTVDEGPRRIREFTVVPVEMPAPEDIQARLGSASMRDCSKCLRRFTAAQIVTSSPYFAHVIDGHIIEGEVVDRTLYCPDCGHLQRWVEGYDRAWMTPNKVACCLPTHSTNALEIKAFLEEHPEALAGESIA